MALPLIFSIIGAMGEMQAGAAAKKSADLDAFNIETDKVRSEIETRQRHAARREAYDRNTSANIAAVYASGRDVSSRSVEAFLGAQKETLGKDIRTSDLMGMFEAMKLRQQATTVRVEGRARQQAATISAFTTIGKGIADYGDYKKQENKQWQ